MTPEFAEAVGPVVRWARENGWERDAYPCHYRSAEFRLVADDTGWILVNDTNLGFTRGLARFRGDSPWQAIDVLCALGVLPFKFSTAYLAGVRDANPTGAYEDGYRVGYGRGRDDEAEFSHRLRANRPGATCVCDSRYDGCDHGIPCRRTPDGTGRGPWCSECNPRRLDSIRRSLEDLRESFETARHIEPRSHA